ncbi:Hypothetical predicted protein [Olea europaea subsp. europaea]|uniref:Uncharacterized protein n=1 Tax=Olea europaea subsp. europaea TaxID=158383 RepID=A0A8S0RHJ4_OLEEU|nr:Hypothetical predicted protein [Olea europaea subsp. europaea]
MTTDIENVLRSNEKPVTKVDCSFTCSNDCGYFDWVKDEDVGGESSSIQHAVNQSPDKEDEELPRLFDGLARISEKRDVDISLHLTFSKGKGIANCNGKGKRSD